MGARHYHGQIGDTYIFMDEAGNTQEAIILDRIDMNTVSTSPPQISDICMTYLDRDITGCTTYKVMPEGWEAAYAPSALAVKETDLAHLRYTRHGIQDIANDKGGTMHVSSLRRYTTDSYSWDDSPFYFIRESDFNNWADWTQSNGYLEGGDSGCPDFLVLDFGSGPECIYLGAGYVVTGISAVSSFQSYLNTMMNDMATAQNTAGQPNNDTNAGSYAVGIPTLTGFNDYTP